MKKLPPSPPARKLILRDGLPFAAEAAAETPEQVPSMIAEALRHDGPALVEVLVNRQELSMPPTITLEQVRGFSLFMLKAVLSGRGDEIVDLAKTNLFR
jgi:pyruvate dehydrogenase (quinone)